MKLVPLSLFVALGLVHCSCSASASAVRSPSISDQPSRLNIYLGQRALDEDDYDPVDQQATFGLELASGGGESVGWEIGLAASYDDDEFLGFDVEGRTGELYGGVRKEFGGSNVHPYVGGGIAFIRSEVEVVGVGDDDDASPAGYVHGGIAFDVTPQVLVGIDVRALFGSDMEIGGVDTDADYGQVAVFLGVRL